MDRRAFLIGTTALVLSAGTVSVEARAWGANGYMTRRVRKAEAAGAFAYRQGKTIEDNPYHIDNEYEFNAWAAAFNRAAFFGKMTPEERAAYDNAQRMQHDAEIAQRKQDALDMQNRIASVGLALAGTMVGVVMVSIFMVKTLVDPTKVAPRELKPWEKE